MSASSGGPAVEPSDPAYGSVNRITPTRFIVGFGLVSALADVVYEGARSIIGPYLGTLGASAATVGLVTGAGEAAALVLRVFTGRLTDRTQRPWPQTIAGYVMTALCVPLLALTSSLVPAIVLYTGERVGKAVRTPARDTMLAHASAKLGRGYAFGLHEALDQIGAMLGPLLIAAVLAWTGHYQLAFGMLAVPGLLAIVMVARLRRAAPAPTLWEPEVSVAESKRLRLETGLPAAFWHYAAFSAVTMLGFSTWAVLGYHLVVRHLVAPAIVPVLYALAMGAASLAAVGFGRLYDRYSLRGLLVLPFLAALVPALSFSGNPVAFTAGAVVWGAAMGVHESTMRAAVADFVPAYRRGAAYGTFTAVYGLAWLGGAALIGSLYDHGVGVVTAFVGGVQVVALVLIVTLLRRTRPGAEAAGSAALT